MVGRRLVLVLPMLGITLCSICNLLNSIWMNSSIWYLLIGSFVYGLSGGYVTLLMAMFRYSTAGVIILNLYSQKAMLANHPSNPMYYYLSM